MKEILKIFLEKYGTKLFPFFIGFLSMFILLFFYDLVKQEFIKKTLQEDIVIEEKPVYKISTKKSKIYLECIYEQLECYNKNVGLKKEIVLEACQEINYCDKK